MPTQTFKVGEILNKRSLNSKTWINFDGSYTAEIHNSQVHFEDENGNLQNINTDLFDEADLDLIDEPVAKEGHDRFIAARDRAKDDKKKGKLDRDLYDFQGLKVPFDARIPRNFKRGYTIGHGGNKLKFKPVGASPSKGYVDEDQTNLIHFQDAWNDADVLLELTTTGIKETIVLKTDRAPSTFTFEVDGVLENNLTSGTLKLQPAWLQDANGEKRDVVQKTRTDGDQTFIDLVADVTGLVYPISIDPTVNLYNTSITNDTYVYSNTPTTSYGTQTVLAVGRTTSSLFWESYIKFDLSSIPSGAIISAATLSVTAMSNMSGGAGDTFTFNVQTVTGAFSDTTTWNTKPTTMDNGDTSATTGYSYANGVTYNLSAIKSTQYLMSHTNYGFALVSKTAAGANGAAKSFNSKEYTSSQPSLSVTYNTPPTAPVVTAPNGGETWNAQQTVTWTAAADPETTQTSLQYQIQLSTDNGANWKDVVGLTSAGATSYSYNFTNEAQSSTCLIRVRAYDGTDYGPWDQSNGVFTIQHNTAPTAPTNINPSGGSSQDRAKTVHFSWQHNDPNTPDPQSKFDLQWRLQGASTWNTVTQVTTNQFYDIPANTLPHGNIEWQVRTYDQAGLSGPYSNIAVFFAGDKPSNPTITSPTDGETVPVSNPTVQWSSSGQTAYDLKVLDISNALLWESVKTSTNKAETVGIALSNSTDCKIQVAIKNADGLWSDYVTAAIHVSYTPPAKPTLTINNGQANITLNIDHPVPISPQPTVTSVDIYRKKTIEQDFVRVAVNENDSFIDSTLAAGEQHDYKVRAFGDNGTFTDSDIISASIDFKGVWLFDTTDPSTLYQFKFDSDRSDKWDSNGSLTKFAGRRLPLAEFDDTESHSVSVNLKIKKADDDLSVLSQMIRSKNTLCYRDGRGRKLFCQVLSLPVTDQVYGNTIGVTFDEVSYTEEV